jgi:hypothetical protein
VQQLDRHGALELAVAALRQPNGTHPTLAERAFEPIGPDRHPREIGDLEALEKPRLVGELLLFEQRAELAAELRRFSR